MGQVKRRAVNLAIAAIMALYIAASTVVLAYSAGYTRLPSGTSIGKFLSSIQAVEFDGAAQADGPNSHSAPVLRR